MQDRWLEQLGQFKRVVVNCSLEGMGAMNDYLRPPSNWDSVWKNFTSGSNGDVHTASVWVKAAGVNYARIYVDTVGGNLGGPGVTFSTKNTWNVSATGVATQTASSVVEYPNGWWRLSVTGSFSNRNDYYCHVDLEGGEGDIGFTGNNSNGMYVWGVQLEKGGYATSLISTNGGSTTRGGDFAYLDGTFGTHFDDIYNTDQGTFVVDWFNNPDGNHNDGYVFTVDDGTGNNRIAAVNSNGYQVSVVDSGSSQGTRDLGSINSGANKIAFTYKLNDQATSLNGTDASVDTSCTLPTGLKYWWIGLRQGQYDMLGGYVRRIIYYPKRLPNNQLKTLSS